MVAIKFLVTRCQKNKKEAYCPNNQIANNKEQINCNK
jgi:hypothetical protein